MHDLNKTQLILLALLVSFVSSIATGIVTVTLMQQAPSGVTQTINRVVEKTIEKVIPIKGPTVTETKIVKEEDLIIGAISNNQKSIVRMTIAADPSTDSSGGKVGNGIILSEDGLIVTDSGTAAATDQSYYAETADGQILELSRIADKKGFTLFKVILNDKNSAVKFSAAALGDSDSVKVGQSIISLGDSAATGIVSGLQYEKSEATTTPKVLSLIRSSTNSKDDLGSAIITLNGNVVGIVAVRGGIRTTIPTNSLKDAISEAQKKK